MYYEEIAPEVIPGVYRATIKLGDHEEKVNIRVISDPHVRNSLSQWRALDDAIVRLGRVNDVAVDALNRLGRLKSDFKVIDRKLSEEAFEMRDMLLELEETRSGLEEMLWISEEMKGIPPKNDVMSQIAYAHYVIASSYNPPSKNQLQWLAQAERKLRAFLFDFNFFYAQPLAEFRNLLQDAGLDLLGYEKPILFDTPRPRRQ